MSTIRSAKPSDLPRIIELIRQSFAAMSEHYGDAPSPSIWEKGVADAVKEDLNEHQFNSVYFQNPASNFWVAESQDQGITGCVGLKRKNGDEAELVRMAVDSTLRGQGTGSKLVKHLLAHCKAHRLCRVLLTTANPASKRFYERSGFLLSKTFAFPLVVPDVCSLSINVFSMTYYVGAKIVRRVGLTGGTHGNELLGIELVKRWQQRLGQEEEGDELQRRTLRCLPVLSNLPAIALNRRYVDKDLNRQFRRETLDAILRNTAEAEGVQGVEVEDYCAARLNALLGPKTEFYTQRTGVDFIVDMHSSTSSLGNMLILGCLTHDNLAALAAYTVKERLSHPSPSLANGVLRVASPDVTKEASHWLDSMAPSGLAIEVGPLAHGTMNASLLQDTRLIVLALLDFLEERNLTLLREAEATAATALSALADAEAASDPEIEADTELLADARAFDFATSEYLPRSLVPSSLVPAVVAAAAAVGAGGPDLDYFHMVNPLLFPTADVQEAGRQSAGAAAEEAGFRSLPAAVAAKLAPAREQVLTTPPREAILHAAMDGRDWEPLREGAPLFQPLDGVSEVQPFSRATHCPTEKDSDAALFPVFINEAAYQGSNMACWIVKDAKFTLY